MNNVYEILRRPLVTEKSNYLSSHLRQYAFEVANEATQSMVKDAVENLFDVTVVRVNVMNMPAKRGRKGRNRRMTISRDAFKKAIVTLAAGDRIPIFEGVE
jgi:large subunit ribosomal protein L23